MQTTRISRAVRGPSRLLAPLATSLLACLSGSSGATPAGTTPPSIASLSFYPPHALVNEGGGMVSVPYHVYVNDPEADAARVVATVLDETGAQVGQEAEYLQPAAAQEISGTVLVPTTAAATYAIQVQAFDAGERGSNLLRAPFSVVVGNPVPFIEALSPASAAAQTDPFTLRITGSGFVDGSTVSWNGYPRTTTYVDATTLQVRVDASDLYWAGAAQITVTNPFPGGGTSSPATFVIDAGPPPEPRPVPELSSVSPASADAGTSSLALTVTGNAFSPSSYVLWNGSSVSTTYVDATTLTATVPGSWYLASPGTAIVKVTTPAPGGGTSSGLAFTVTRPQQPGVLVVALDANDLAWDPYQRKIYASVPSLSPVNPNTVTVIDPFTGELTGSQFVGSEPRRLALSDDGQFLYVALGGATSVERLRVPSLALDLGFGLGRDAAYGPYYARDLQVAPGSPTTIAVSLSTSSSSGSASSGGIAVFDDATQRPTRATSAVSWYPYGSLQWGATASTLYATSTGYEDDLYTFDVDTTGVVVRGTYRLSAYALGIRFDAGTGLAYADDGRVVDPATGLVAGTYPTGSLYQPRVVPDASLGSVFFASADSSSYGPHVVISAYDMLGYFPTRSMTARYVGAPPQQAIRWGADGLAFVTSDFVVLVRGSVVLPAATTPSAAPVVTSLSPSSAAAGAPNLRLSVSGEGFVPGSVVLWNGSERTTRFVSATALVAYVPASDFAAAGSADVTVSTPAPGGGTSAVAAFTVNP